ncbi:DUF3095 domain-containing protein, partial [Shimia sp. SDUM112013]|uniref:DUF3095 domain-containing protein n=1 Tax=Shimia sp. SDUM112013 TaxID=3136160 RepID=UPI0032EBDCCB
MQSTQDYYENLPRVADFDRLADPAGYMPLPDDWVVGVADIVGSTQEIARGRYKTVNVVGAAVISAQLNAAEGKRLPYVFGGDGAGFAVWPEQRAAAEAALREVRAWAQLEFGISLRVAMVTVAEIREAGHDLRVARYAPSEGVDYAMFSGGGIAWAERRMKAGYITLPKELGTKAPDLEGLSCRWSNIASENGVILSLVIEPAEGVSDDAFAKVSRKIVRIAAAANRAGHPIPKNGPGFQFPPEGLSLEAQVTHKGRPLWLEKARLLAMNLMIWALFRTNMRLGKFRPDVYRQEVGQNADFRKFDDGLKMTLDCDPATQARIEKELARAAAKGLIRYGLHAQDEAMMTCLVPSASENTHMHFVDGAAGG